MALVVAQIVKNLPAMQETRVQSLGWEDLGEGNGNPLQYSCLENPLDRGAWQAAVHGVTESWTRLSALACTHAGMDGEINTWMDGWIDVHKANKQEVALWAR